MSEVAKHDAWSAGDSYDAYMGRWSRKMATRFLDWLKPAEKRDWLDVGCGTGALSSAVLSRCNPRSIVGIEQSAGFVATAQRNVDDGRARFEVGDAQKLPLDDHSRDIVASALVLNFVPDIPKALSEMKRVARPGGTVAFYVWDYPGGGMGFMRAFWNAAIALDPGASGFAEGKRFPFCTAAGLTELAANAGLQSVECTAHRNSHRLCGFRRLLAPLYARRRTSTGILRQPPRRSARKTAQETQRRSAPPGQWHHYPHRKGLGNQSSRRLNL